MPDRLWTDMRGHNDAPDFYGSEEASAWAAGWNAAVEAALQMAAVRVAARETAAAASVALGWHRCDVRRREHYEPCGCNCDGCTKAKVHA